MPLRKLALSALALAALTGSSAAATLGLGDILVTKGGQVTATFLGHTAGYSNDLFLEMAGGDRFLFNNQETATGAVLELGRFAAGTELKLYISVRNTGDLFFTGAGSRNADGLAHAVVTQGEEVHVGFEDLYGGGDRDYDDLRFSFTNVAPAPSAVPLPASGLLLAGAVCTVAVARRRLR